ncbi:hypothetical protein [Selenomonas sp. AE3005]|uniref:hypothetical protein n=1 Tax=Selenomonas sp. AE3005 TaxID=1485543 RepID=UPI0025E29821|nr:hypothetical protein [Selenomonas sp. AE3005]
MTKENLDNLRELLCEFNCTYVLDKNREVVIDKAVDIVTEVMEMEVEHDNKCGSCKYGTYSSCDGSCPLTN